MAEKEHIEREAATAYAPLPKELREYQTGNLDDAWDDGYDFAISQINAIPAADVRPVVRGKWKLATYSGKYGSAKGKWYDQFLDGAFWYCDNCKERAAKKTNYCPNCGADMREDIDGR